MQVFDIPTRWGDMDAQAHVNNGVLVDYLQEARTELLLAGPNAHMLGGGVVVSGHQVEFVRPVLHGETVRARVCVDQLGAARFTLAYELVADDEVAVRARSVLCPYDFETQRVRRLTPAERDHFATLQDTVEPLRDLGRAGIGADPHVLPVRVRWGDLDSYGHVNNVRAFDYVQEARIAMMNEADPTSVSSAGTGGHLWLVVRQDVDYVNQMHFRLEPYPARTSVVGVGRTSLTLACEISDDATGEIFHRARTVLVCAGPDSRPVEIPASLRSRLAPAGA